MGFTGLKLGESPVRPGLPAGTSMVSPCVSGHNWNGVCLGFGPLTGRVCEHGNLGLHSLGFVPGPLAKLRHSPKLIIWHKSVLPLLRRRKRARIIHVDLLGQEASRKFKIWKNLILQCTMTAKIRFSSRDSYWAIEQAIGFTSNDIHIVCPNNKKPVELCKVYSNSKVQRKSITDISQVHAKQLKAQAGSFAGC
eukprot:Gb_15850 [translate_table: standard]